MKKIYIFVICAAVLCVGSVYGAVFTAIAEQADMPEDTYIEEPAEEPTQEDDHEYEVVPESEPEPEESAPPEESEPEDTAVLPEDNQDGSQPEDSSESEGEDSSHSESLPEPTETEEQSQPEMPQPPAAEIEEERQVDPHVAQAMQAAYDNLDAYITRTADLLGMPSGYVRDLGEDNFFDALAVYAIRSGQTEHFPYAVDLTAEEDRDELASIYWSLNPVNAANTKVGSIVQIRRVSAKNAYGLTGEEAATFSQLCTDDNRQMVAQILRQ